MKLTRRSRTDGPAVATPAVDDIDERLGSVLVGAGEVQPYQLDAARNAAGDSLVERLLATDAITDRRMAAALAKHYGLELVDFRELTAKADAVALLSARQARSLGALSRCRYRWTTSGPSHRSSRRSRRRSRAARPPRRRRPTGRPRR